MVFINLSAYLLALTASVPLLVLACECFLALLPSRKGSLGDRSQCAVLIPAHNEEQVLAKTLLNVREQLAENDRLIVVADNCTDRTVEIAHRHGAETVVRNDADNRG